MQQCCTVGIASLEHEGALQIWRAHLHEVLQRRFVGVHFLPRPRRGSAASPTGLPLAHVGFAKCAGATVAARNSRARSVRGTRTDFRFFHESVDPINHLSRIEAPVSRGCFDSWQLNYMSNVELCAVLSCRCVYACLSVWWSVCCVVVLRFIFCKLSGHECVRGTQVIFHRPSFHKAMKEWTEQANLAGSPLPYFHPEWFAQNYGPRAATPSGSA